MSVFEQILALLEKHNIPYKLTEHEPVRTSEEAARIRGAALKTGAKAMIVRGKDDYHLLVLPAYKHIDWKRVRALLHVSNLRFATEEEAETVAQAKMGSVPPFFQSPQAGSEHTESAAAPLEHKDTQKTRKGQVSRH